MGSRTGMLKKFRANFDSFEEIWLFIQIFLLVTVLPFRLKFLSLPLPRVMKTLAPRDFKICRNMDMEKLKGKIVKFTDYILGRNFFMYKSTCLKRSLVLYYFLRKSGINVHICFGVKYNDKLSDKEAKEKLEGHAWLLYQGDIFLERNVELTKTYTITYYFPAKHL